MKCYNKKDYYQAAFLYWQHHEVEPSLLSDDESKVAILDQYFIHFGHEFAGRDDCARHYYGNFKSFMRDLTSVIMEGMLATAMFGGNGKIEKVVTL